MDHNSFFPEAPEIRPGVARRRGSPPARSGLAASAAGEEPRQDPAQICPETGKTATHLKTFALELTIRKLGRSDSDSKEIL